MRLRFDRGLLALLCIFVILPPTASFYKTNSNNDIRNSIRTYPGGFCRKLLTKLADQNDLEAALKELKEFDDAYLGRLKQARADGKAMDLVELERAQQLKADGLKTERDGLRQATTSTASQATEVVLGIMSDSGTRGIRVLKSWVTGLSLPRGVLRALDEKTGDEVSIDEWNDRPVYIKYNSSDNGNAYMKTYDGGNVGVIFQPKLNQNDTFYQFGDFPLTLFG